MSILKLGNLTNKLEKKRVVQTSEETCRKLMAQLQQANCMQNLEMALK